jgi:hypothetical protein
MRHEHVAIPALMALLLLGPPYAHGVGAEPGDSEAAIKAIGAWETEARIALSPEVRMRIIKDYADAVEWMRSRKDAPPRAAIDKAIAPALRTYLTDIVDNDTAISLDVRLAEQLGRSGFSLPRRHSLGVVRVTTHPDQALVSVDGREFSLAKAVLVTSGRHILRARLAGFQDCVLTIEVKVSETSLECTLARSSPGGAKRD